MPDVKKNIKAAASPEKMTHFQWGGRTQEWEEEADQIMHFLQDQIDDREAYVDKKKKNQYGKQKQYW